MTDHRTRMRATLAECFLRILPRLDPALVAKARMGDPPQWDSMTTLELVAEVEQSFDIAIGLHEVGFLDNFEAFAQCVARHLAAR